VKDIKIALFARHEELPDLGFEVRDVLKGADVVLSNFGHIGKAVIQVDGTVVEKNFIHLRYGDFQEISPLFITK
jgi:hypothetical protein